MGTAIRASVYLLGGVCLWAVLALIGWLLPGVRSALVAVFDEVTLVWMLCAGMIMSVAGRAVWIWSTTRTTSSRRVGVWLTVAGAVLCLVTVMIAGVAWPVIGR